MSKRSPSRSVRQRFTRSALPESKASRLSSQAYARENEASQAVAPRAQEPHAAFAAHANMLFGNRVVSAALNGALGNATGGAMSGSDEVGPESLIHSVLALGAAGVHVGDDVFSAFGNDRLASVLSDGPGADPWAPELLALGPQGDVDSGGETFGQDVWSNTVDSVLARRPTGQDGGGSGGAQRALDAASQSGGQRLPGSLKAELEARFGGADFGSVKIHTDGAAQAAATAIDAAAYTMGTEIWFGPGQFAPDTERGMHLLAHELTHVLQNLRGDGRTGGGGEVDGVAVSMPSDAREVEAEAVAHDVMRGETPEIAEASAEDETTATMSATGIAERKPGPNPEPGDTKTITLPDGTETELHSDGKGGHYITGPKGEHLACDAQGKPTPAALNHMTGDARNRGENGPKPPRPADTRPAPKDPGTQKGGAKQAEGAKGSGNAPAGPAAGGAAQNAPKAHGPGGYGELAAGPLAKYAQEKAWHDSWKAAGSQVQGAGTPDVADSASLVGTALLSGAAQGGTQGAQAAMVDVVLNKATSKIPYAAGFIAMAQIAYDPKEWWQETIVKGIGGKVGGGLDKLLSGDSDWIDRLEGVLNILEGLNNIIGLLSTVCLIVAAAGFILSFICPALIPFVALAAKWGLLLGEINTVVGLGLNAMRLILVIARAVQIAVGDADPETQAKRAEKLKDMMTDWSSDFTARRGNKLAGKLQTKTGGPAPHTEGHPPPHVDGSAAGQKKSTWKSRLGKLGNAVVGHQDAHEGMGRVRQQRDEAMGMTKAARGNKFGSREQLRAMQDIDPNAVSERTAERHNKKADQKTARADNRERVMRNLAENRKAMAANNEGKGLSGGSTATSHVENGQRTRADIRKRATDPDFWDDANKGERKALRRQLEKSNAPTDVELARQMTQAERRLKEFSTDKDFQTGVHDNAAVRVTTESALHERGTVSPRGVQGVTKLEDSRGVHGAHEMADRLGFDKTYRHDTQNNPKGYEHTDWNGKKTQGRQDHFVAAIYSPEGPLVKSTGQSMAQQLAQHANADGLYGKNPAEIQRNITRAMNTPKAPNAQAITDRPDLYGTPKIQAIKERLKNDIGANQQKTTDGRTLTESGHNDHEAAYTGKVNAIRERETSGQISGREAQSQRDRARNKQDRTRQGDSHTEYYDTQATAGTTNPLKVGTGRKLENYNELPVVKRLDWGDQAGGDSKPAPPAARRGVAQWFRESGIGSGAEQTVRGMANRDNLAGDQVEANAYGHQGTGGYTGAANKPVVGALNGLLSQTVTDESGKEKTVSAMDRVTNVISGGVAGMDEQGNSGFDQATQSWVAEQQQKLKERLANFDQQHISTTQLTDPPVSSESILDSANASWEAYDAEIVLLRGSARTNEGLKAQATIERAALDSEQSLIDANKTQVQGQKTELQQKEQNQQKADQKIGEQSTKGGELGTTTGGVMGTVTGFITGFFEMCGLIPSSLSSSGGSAKAGASKIQEGFKKTGEAATDTQQNADRATTTVEGHRKRTETATEDTTQSEAKIEGLSGTIAATKAETDAGRQELNAASQDIEQRIAAMEAGKQEELARSQSAQGITGGWADEHSQARGGEESAGEEELVKIEQEAEELNKKAAEEGEAVSGTAFASLAGPAPVRAPTVTADAFSQGAPLPEAVRSRMGAAFGEDFADVKVHVGSQAADATAGFNARAFAFGSDVLFGAGQFNPGTASGDRLIAHELQHVVQQRQGPKGVAQKGLKLGGIGGFAELDADRVANQIVDRLHGSATRNGDTTAPRRGRDPEARQNTPETPGAGGQPGGTNLSRGRADENGESGPSIRLSGNLNIGGVQIGGSLRASENGVRASANAHGNVAGVPVSAQVDNDGASVQIGQDGERNAGRNAGRGHAPGAEHGGHGKPGEGGPRGPAGAERGPGGAENAHERRAAPNGERSKGHGAGGAGGPAAARPEGHEKANGALRAKGAANVDASRTQGGNNERGHGPGQNKGATPSVLQSGNPDVAALGGPVAEVMNAVDSAKSALFGEPPVVPGRRELPRLEAGNVRLPKDQDQQLRKATGLTANQHRQAISLETDHVRDEVKALQDDAGRYGVEEKTALSTEIASRTGECQATADQALAGIAGAFSDARKQVTDAVAAAKANIDAGAAAAQSTLDAALPVGKAALVNAYDTGKKALSELKSRWVEPFDTMVDTASLKFGEEAAAASAELAAQKTDILRAWPTSGGDALTNAENEARRNAASRGIDQAVADFKNGGKAKADAIIAQKPLYQKQVTDAVTPVEQQLEQLRQQGEAALDAAHAQATSQIAADRATANAQIDGAHATATGSLDSSEKASKGQVSAAHGRLGSDIQAAQLGADTQIDAAAAGLGERYAVWMDGVLGGVPKDQPMQKKTADEYLGKKRQEMARFHQQVLDELLGVCDNARTALNGTITTSNDNIRALGESGAGSARTAADGQIHAVQDAAGTFAQSMTLVSGAVDGAIQRHVAPIAQTVAGRVAETETSLQRQKATAEQTILGQATAYGAELRGQIGSMVQKLTPMADAAAQRVRPELVQRAEKVFKACKGLGTDENMLNDGLRGLTALGGRALENSVWPDLHQAEGGMRAFINDDVSGTDRDIATAYLSGNTALGAKLELNNSLHWYGDDEAQIEKVLRELSPEDRKAMQDLPGWSEVRANLCDDLGGTDLDVTKALLAGNTARADAYRLRDKINEARNDGDPDALHKALEGVDPEQLAAVQQEFHNIQNKVDPEATNVPAIDPKDAANELSAYSTRHIQGTADLQGANKNLAEALAVKGRESDEASIHRFEVERGREGGPEQEGLEKALYANPRLQEQLHDPDPQVRAKAQQEQAARESRIREGYATAYGNGNANAMQDAMGKMYAGDDHADVRQRMVQNMLSDGTNTPRVAADSIYLNAKAKTGTDEAAVKRALTGMRPDEVQETSRVYAEKHGNGDATAMAKDLGVVERNPDGTRKEDGDHSGWGSELSGDDRREVEELMMGDARYQTPQQQLALARLQKDWTVGDESTMIGRGLLSGTNEREDLDRNFKRMEAAAAQMNPDGTFKGATPEEQKQNQLAFERAAGDAGINATNYRAAGDRTAGYITTAIAVVGAVVITAATFGAGAPAGMGLIAAAGAGATGLASMGTNYALKGGRYGWEQGVTDLALTAVTAATAGAGASLEVMNGGGGVLANFSGISSAAGKQVVGQTLTGLGTGLVNGAASAALTDGTWDHGFSKGMQTVGANAGKQAVVEGVSAAVSTGIDESAWGKAQEHKNLLQSSLARGASEGIAGSTSTAAGIGVDAARGKYKGDVGDAAQTIATEGGKQFVAGTAGSAVGKAYVAPWAKARQQEAAGSSSTVNSPDAPIQSPETTQTPVSNTGATLEGNTDGMVATLKDRTITTSANGAVSKHNDGTKEVRNNDGTLTRIDPDGSYKTMLPDGTIVLETAGGDRAQITKDGEYVQLGPDGKPLHADAKENGEGPGPSLRQREDALVNKLEALIEAKRISQDDAMRVIDAGDINAQEAALTALANAARK